MKEHTQGSWTIRYNQDGIYIVAETDSGITYLARVAEGISDDEAEPKANAEFIVLACNSHDALLEALIDIASYASLPTTPFVILENADAAIRLARGEPARA